MNTSLLTRCQELLREMNYGSLGNRPLDVTTIPPRLLYDLVLSAARCIADQNAANADVTLQRLLYAVYPYDHGEWVLVENNPAPSKTAPGPYLYRRCYSPVTRVVQWRKGRWLAAELPATPVPWRAGDLWRPMSNPELKEWNS